MLWLAQYFFIRCGKLKSLTFETINDSSKYNHAIDTEQCIRFLKPADVILCGFAESKYGSRQSNSKKVEERARQGSFLYSVNYLVHAMSTAVRGILECRPASVNAWLAIEFCRQSEKVAMISWNRQLINTTIRAAFIREHCASNLRSKIT